MSADNKEQRESETVAAGAGHESELEDLEYDDDLSETHAIPDFDAFSSEPVFRNLKNIAGFNIVIEIPKMFHWLGTEMAPVVVGRMFEEVLVVLEGAGFYSYDRLTPIIATQRAGVRYEDDEFQFEVFFDEDGDLHINRSGSSLQRFHNWYVRCMPSINSMVERILTAVVETEQMNFVSRAGPHLEGMRQRELRPVSASYAFRFIAYDIQRLPDPSVQKNVVVLGQLLQRFPGDHGELVDAEKADLARLGRIDVAVSRWVDDVDAGWAREIYRVEGPSNRRYTSLWLEFVYKGESFETPEGKREAFASDRFLRAYEVPYVAFLKGRALEHFVADLTEGCVFETSTGSLP